MDYVHPAIMIIDDEEDVREMLSDFFLSRGYAVETAISGDDALAKLRAGARPCVILMDLLMPDTNGFLFRSTQMTLPEIAHIPLIAHSGVRDIARYAELLNADAFIQKPANLDDIMAVVDTHCLK